MVGCLAGGTAFGIASSKRKQFVAETKARFLSLDKELWKYGATDYSHKEKYASFTSLIMPIGDPVVGEKFEYNINDNVMNNSKSPLFHHLKDRVVSLRQMWQPDYRMVRENVFEGGHGKIQCQAFACFGVMFFEVKGSDGVVRKHATDVTGSITFRDSSDLTHPVPKPNWEYLNLTRADFDNPEDIDWMFDLKDFTHPEYQE